MLLHLVFLNNNKEEKTLCWENDIKDDKIIVSTNTDDGESSYDWIPITIVKSYFVEINAKFIMNPKDDSPMHTPAGILELHHLAYTYSINIIEYKGWDTLFDKEPLYSKSGIGRSDFPMYSYHHFDDKGKIVYEHDKLEYEVKQSLHNLNEILLPVDIKS